MKYQTKPILQKFISTPKLKKRLTEKHTRKVSYEFPLDSTTRDKKVFNYYQRNETPIGLSKSYMPSIMLSNSKFSIENK